MRSFYLRAVLYILVSALTLNSAQAEFVTLWSVGNQDGNPLELGEENWGTNAAPGSATNRDNDFYFAGTYPPPIGQVATSEVQTNLERTLNTGNPLTRFHFNLSAQQAITTARLRFALHQVWGGWWNVNTNSNGEDYGSHLLEVRLNGVVLKSELFTSRGSLILEINAGTGPGTFTPQVGPNVLQISRAGGITNGGVQIDAVSLEWHATALVDADTDGLPRWWEEDHGLRDDLAADALIDSDEDGLNSLAEFAQKTNPQEEDSDKDGLKDGAEVSAGTQPLVADSDGDSLLDGEEITGVPLTNPLQIDSDGDGAPDAWELRTGFNPTLNTSVPPAWAGSVGLNFVSDLNPQNHLSPSAVTGFTPQLNWNNTIPLASWNASQGSELAIATPIPDVLVNSAGAPTAMTMNWLVNSGVWANGNHGSSTGRLLDGYLNVNSDTGGSLTFDQIPFTTYHVIVYVGSVYDGGLGFLRLNDNVSDDRWFLTGSTAPESRFTLPVISSQTKPWRGNTLLFRSVTGRSLNLRIYRTSWHEVGIHGVQIVDATADGDGDDLPTWWEFANKLNPLVNDASADPDGDLLVNSAEWTRQTDPRVADTDGDGLSDLVETNTGAWVSVTNSGSNPLLADTDEDGLTDGFEVALKPNPTNPNSNDTDGDGRLDAEEIRGWTNPTVAEAVNAQMPVITTSPRTFNWTVENVQIVWDHTRGHVADEEWGDSSLMNFQIVNSASTGSDAFNIGLRVKAERVSHFLYSGNQGGFSHPDNDAWEIWEADWVNQPTDRRAALGFSGHGRVDISDRLRFQITGTSTGGQSDWNITFRIFNQDTSQNVVLRTFTGCRASNQIQNNTVVWQDRSDPPLTNRLQIWEHEGVKVYFQNTPLEDSAAFAAAKDTDEDGMPSVWEDTHSFNKNSAADAALDADTDGLSNLREYLVGTNPRDADSDDDGARDGLEVESGSNPLLATSLPPLYGGPPGGVMSEDFNGNGMADAWEQWAGTFDLQAMLDADGDGTTNGNESIAGTDPLDATSRVWSATIRNGNDLVVCWPLLAHKQHRVWQSATLASGSWSPALGSPLAVGQEYRQTFTGVLAGGAPVFYQARINDTDADGDGVSDWTETNVLGSNPASANSTRSPVSTDVNQDGNPEGTLSGDYTTLVEQLEGSRSAGGFPGGSGTSISRAQAARFLMQATFGPTLPDIQRVQALGYSAWIAEQKALSPTLHSTYIQGIYRDMLGQRSQSNFNRGGEVESPFLFGNNMMTAFARASIQGEDQLRQRMAFALSQILVTSRRDANLENQCIGISNYYDIFVRRAFGNYLDILMEVTMHPVMGRYLSHVGNQKADPSINRYPDENYAREIMQLFTVGLWELNPDGTQKLNGSNQPIPTYSNAEITQLARVMTGFWFGGHNWGGGGWTDADHATPMSLHAERHDFGQKTLLGGFVIPARAATQENAVRDVRDAVRHLFEHPNTAVFVGRQLIQFLVTDNPSPAFVQRIASTFADNGNGVRGDLAAVMQAILLDEEARDPRFSEAAAQGRLKEPVIRTMALARAFGMKEVPDLLWWDWGDFFNASRQEPTYSPSVFNFYRPDYRAPGLLTQRNLAGPVFQITDSFSSISFPNRLWQIMGEGFAQWRTYSFPLDLSHEKQLAGTPERLVDHLNLLFCAGKMRPSTRTLILNAINQIPADQTASRAQVAAYLCLVCPEGAVMK